MIKVIGAGLGRTGTNSLQLALQKLEFDKCYHMQELIGANSHLPYWETALETGTTDWDALFTGYRATVDYPGALFYQDMLRKFPDAKVILTVRDPEKWYESVRSTIFMMSQMTPIIRRLRWIVPFVREQYATMLFVNKLIWDGQFESRFQDKDFAIATFNVWNESVKAHVPRDRLLVFEIKDGWKPLCEFLNVPLPDEPFPHVNSRMDFRLMMLTLPITNLFKHK